MTDGDAHLLDINEIAKRLGVSRRQVYRYEKHPDHPLRLKLLPSGGNRKKSKKRMTERAFARWVEDLPDDGPSKSQKKRRKR